MSDFVNKIKTKDGTEYNINDERVPQILEESKGKFLKVNDEGNLEFADVPAGGGAKLYKHTLSFEAYGYMQVIGFITTDGTSINSENILSKIVLPLIPSYVADTTNSKQCSLIGIHTNEYGTLIDVSSAGWGGTISSVETYNCSTIKNITDTVTEL